MESTLCRASIFIFSFLLMTGAGYCGEPEVRDLILATTTSTVDSGLLDLPGAHV